MNPQDRLKELQRQIEAFKCGMEARYGKYWKDRADSTSLARYAEMIGKEKGYKQALDDARNKAVVSQMDIYAKIQLVEMLIDRGGTESEIKNMLNTINAASEELIQILTIPEEE